MAVSTAAFSKPSSSTAFWVSSFIVTVWFGRFSMSHFRACVRPFVCIVSGLQRGLRVGSAVGMDMLVCCLGVKVVWVSNFGWKLRRVVVGFAPSFRSCGSFLLSWLIMRFIFFALEMLDQ